MNSIFFNFINPYLSFIDSGKIYRQPFSLLYAVLAALNILFPLYVFYLAVDNSIFDAGAKFIIVFLLSWLIIAFAGWVGFQIWWDRKSNVSQITTNNDGFVATPVFSHLDRKSTRLNSSHVAISYAVFCLKKKKR